MSLLREVLFLFRFEEEFEIVVFDNPVEKMCCFAVFYRNGLLFPKVLEGSTLVGLARGCCRRLSLAPAS